MTKSANAKLIQQLAESIIDSSPDVILVIDIRGYIVFVNDRCESLLGFLPNELIGQQVEILIPGEFPNHQKLRTQYQQNPIPKTMGNRPVLMAQHKSGAQIPVSIALSALALTTEYGPFVQAVIRDAMPHLLAEREKILLSVAMDAAANGIVITNTKGIIEWVNPAITRITGFSSDEMIGQHTRILKSGLHDEMFYKELWQTITSGQTWFGEMSNRRKDGTIYYEEMHIAPVQSEDGIVTHFIAIKQDVTARRIAEMKLRDANDELKRRLEQVEALQQQLHEQSIRDPLTNLFNRRYLNETLTRETIRAQRDNLNLSVIAIDVDYFKQLNDTCGHAAGDAILQMLGQLITTLVRESDIASRLGGDEFLIVMPGSTWKVAQQRAEVLRQEFIQRQQMQQENQTCSVICSLSIGVTQLLSEETIDALLQRCDKALYQAKREGRDRVSVDPLSVQVAEKDWSRQ